MKGDSTFRRHLIALTALGGLGALGCAPKEGPGSDCSDTDGDGYGVGADCLGPDCDDSNPAAWTTAQCEATCQEDLHTTGCGCDLYSEPEGCYDGPEGSLDVGSCLAGIRSCTDDGVWSRCDGQVLPSDEVCDGADNDCDGDVDEGVVDPICGRCLCEPPLEVGAGDDGFDETSGENLAVDGDGCLVPAAAPGSGWSSHVFSAVCDGKNGVWLRIEVEVDLPGETSATVDVRGANLEGDLADQPWAPVGTIPPDEAEMDLPAELDASSCFLEVRVTLDASADTPPALCGIGVYYQPGV